MINHLELAHLYWQRLLSGQDHAIDATAGNGKDTLVLAKILRNGVLLAIDIQPIAIQKTLERLTMELGKDAVKKVHLFCQSHIEFPPLAYQLPIKLITYNLGYLPGGDQTLTTQIDSTLESVKKSLPLIIPGGAISITCYPGHKEGEKEEKELLTLCKSLSYKEWNVAYHQKLNSPHSPSLLWIQKKNLLIIAS